MVRARSEWLLAALLTAACTPDSVPIGATLASEATEDEHAAACGNGKLDYDEICDDGFTDACGTCNANCTGPGSGAVCGDGVVCPELERCDDGYADACGTCNEDCSRPGSGATCGDGILCEEFETCEPDPDDPCGRCSETCDRPGAGPICGDGVVCPGLEACDDGATDGCGPCNADCTGPGSAAVCGDGELCAAIEVCDDGFADPCGSCNADCTAAGSWPVCGDGIVCPEFEECDDGESNSDTVPNACRVSCVAPYCGDGVQDAAEFCDDGWANTSAAWTRRPTCDAACSGVAPYCGDGLAQPEYEDCGEPGLGACPNGEPCNGCSCACMIGGPNRVLLQDLQLWKIVVDGDLLFGLGVGGLNVIDIQVRDAPKVLGQLRTANWRSLAVAGTHVYTVGQDGLSIVDASDPTDPQEIAASVSGNEVAIALLGKHVLTGGSAGLRVVDVTDPSEPAVLGQVATAAGVEIIDIAVAGSYAYAAVVADAGPDLLVFDMSDPSNPDQVGSFDTAGTSLSLATQGNTAYLGMEHVVNSLVQNATIEILDISAPATPQPVVAWTMSETFAGCIDIVGTRLLACAGNNVEILDISNPGAPALLGWLWVPIGADDVARPQNDDYVYVAEKLAFLTGEISDPTSPRPVGGLDGLESSSTLEDISGSLLFNSSHSVIEVVDISDPATPVMASRFEDATGTLSVEQASAVGAFLYVADNSDGEILEIDFSSLASPSIERRHQTANTASRIAVEATPSHVLYSVWSTTETELHVLNRGSWTVESTVSLPDPAREIVASGSLAFVACDNSVIAVDLTVPSNPVVAGTYELSGSVRALAVSAPYVFATEFYGLEIIDTTNVFDLTYVASYYAYPGPAWFHEGEVGGRWLSLMDDYLLVSSNDGIQILDVADIGHPRWAARYHGCGMFIASDRYVYCSLHGRLTVLDACD